MIGVKCLDASEIIAKLSLITDNGDNGKSTSIFKFWVPTNFGFYYGFKIKTFII